MNYYLLALQKYATFSGRASRSEYWFFILINFVVSILVSIVGAFGGDSYGIISLVYFLVMFIPSLAVCARRLHDIGKSGWMMLVALIPLIGIIWLIVLLATKSSPEDNKYGSKSFATPTV